MPSRFARRARRESRGVFEDSPRWRAHGPIATNRVKTPFPGRKDESVACRRFKWSTRRTSPRPAKVGRTSVRPPPTPPPAPCAILQISAARADLTCRRTYFADGLTRPAPAFGSLDFRPFFWSSPDRISHDPDSMTPLPPAAPAPAPPAAPFSAELAALAARFGERTVLVGDLFAATQGRGINLLLILIALPFLTPVPLPGFSIPFGLVVAVIGVRLALGRAPWLPEKLLARALPAGFLPKVLAAAGRIVRFLERFLRPRLGFFHSRAVFGQLAGVIIALSGLLLVLPLPVPFSNGFPGWTVLLFAAAALTRDGACYLAGCVMFLASVAFFVLLALGGSEVFAYIRRAFGV